MMMKKYLSYILVICSIPFFSFCTKGGMDEGSINTINKGTDESGVCNIEKALSAVASTEIDGVPVVTGSSSLHPASNAADAITQRNNFPNFIIKILNKQSFLFRTQC